MKQKLLFLFSLLLLATGLLAGCMVNLNTPEGGVPQTNKEQIKDGEEKEDKKEPEDTENLSDTEEQQDIESQQDIENQQDTENQHEVEIENKEEEEDEPLYDSDILETVEYTSKEEVAEYLYLFGHLPDNFITKKEAKALGWVSKEGNLGEVAPGKSIGGDYFGNYEGNLPEKKGRSYYECDIDSDGGYRGSKRIVFSDDGLIYYTEDHYETFDLLYGEE